MNNSSVPIGFEWIMTLVLIIATLSTIGLIIYKIYEGVRFISLKISQWRKKK
jgi:hypothetical protein